MLKTLFLTLAPLTMSLAAAAAGTRPAAGVSLPPPTAGVMSLEEALARRRSVREFGPGALTPGETSRLLWAAQGITAAGRRTAPSAGATYPLEVYLVASAVDGLSAGVYRYQPGTHRLEVVTDEDISLPLASAAHGQAWLRQAAAVVAITAAFERTTARYGERGERYAHMEAGHAAQNLLLQATALGLGAVPVGAFSDTQVSGLLRLPEGETPLYLIAVGRLPQS